MTTHIQPLTDLPFALPRFGNASEKNVFFVQSAGAYIAPMRAYGLGIVEREGGVPVNTHTRPHNLEFLVASGQHFLVIARAMGIAITHMLPVKGGYKCYKDNDVTRSICFIQKRTEKGSGAIVYTAVLPMRDHAHVLMAGIWPVKFLAPHQDSFLDSVPSDVNVNFLPAPPDTGYEPIPLETMATEAYAPASMMNYAIHESHLPPGM